MKHQISSGYLMFRLTHTSHAYRSARNVRLKLFACHMKNKHFKRLVVSVWYIHHNWHYKICVCCMLSQDTNIIKHVYRMGPPSYKLVYKTNHYNPH